MVMRRQFLTGLGLGGASLAVSGPASAGTIRLHEEVSQSPEAERLYASIVGFPIDDSHCHALTDRDARTTPQRFLERISLTAWPARAYFPKGVLERWRNGDKATRSELDARYGIEAKLAGITSHVAESIFVKHMVKEMAEFLDCKPQLEAVIEARNDRGRNYWGYINDLFKDINASNMMIDTGYREGMDAKDIARFEAAIRPARGRRILRVETVLAELFRQDRSFDDLERQFLAAVERGLDKDGNFGTRSWGMKSYLMPKIGVVKPLYDRAIARTSWQEYIDTREQQYNDREEKAHRGKDIKRYLLTLALEECLKRDMPMQFHAGDGEAPGVILRQQDPYNLEEMVRFDRDGLMRMPKVIPLHAGYPLVGRAAWLSHLYSNCYFDLSIMTPLVHQGLFSRYLQVMEVVPLSKILFASDAFHVPELYWLSGRWGKRYLSHAMATYVRAGSLSEEEALEGARMILYKNNRAVYNLPE